MAQETACAWVCACSEHAFSCLGFISQFKLRVVASSWIFLSKRASLVAMRVPGQTSGYRACSPQFSSTHRRRHHAHSSQSEQSLNTHPQHSTACVHHIGAHMQPRGKSPLFAGLRLNRAKLHERRKGATNCQLRPARFLERFAQEPGVQRRPELLSSACSAAASSHVHQRFFRRRSQRLQV